jgi:hypothetical protein
MQPFLASVAAAGEWPLVFFRGRHSHAAKERVTLPRAASVDVLCAAETNRTLTIRAQPRRRHGQHSLRRAMSWSPGQTPTAVRPHLRRPLRSEQNTIRTDEDNQLPPRAPMPSK